MIRKFGLLAALTLANAAQAHVSLDQAAAPAGAGYKAVFRISHGCEGTPTHTVTVRLPPGFRGAKPMPKPGWDISIERALLAKPYESRGQRVTEDVVAVVWKAASPGSRLPDAHFDEFVLYGQAPETPGPAWFKLQQLCEKGQWDWAEVPTSGTSTQGLKSPAVLLNVQPKAAASHQH